VVIRQGEMVLSSKRFRLDIKKNIKYKEKRLFSVRMVRLPG